MVQLAQQFFSGVVTQIHELQLAQVAEAGPHGSAPQVQVSEKACQLHREPRARVPFA